MSACDVIVIGAGPAGAIAARQLAIAGASVMLMDRSRFPRDKVCGGCLNAAALEQLNAIGLGDVADGTPTRSLRLHAGGHRAVLAVDGVAISRRTFDMKLIERAIDAGVRFLPETHGTLGPEEDGYRYVGLRKARLVLLADGLGGSACHEVPQLQVRVNPHSHMGISTVIDRVPAWQHPGAIDMFCGCHGYVGMVRVADGRLNVAAAMKPAFVRTVGGPRAAVMRTLAGCRFNDADLTDGQWRGTGLLTRRRASLAAERVFVLGDAAGYVEPFTGEGMAWAIAEAAAVTPLALEAIERWDSAHVKQWSRVHRRIVGRRQWACRFVAAALRRPVLMRGVVALLSHEPALARPIVHAVQHRTQKGLAT